MQHVSHTDIWKGVIQTEGEEQVLALRQGHSYCARETVRRQMKWGQGKHMDGVALRAGCHELTYVLRDHSDISMKNRE